MSQDIPVLVSFAERLLQLVRQMMDGQIDYDDTKDHLAFMLLCFASKEAEHYQSTLALVRVGLGRDAALIARSMMEGLALLTWAAQEPSTRPLFWRTYAWIEDWRLMRDKEAVGQTVDPSVKQDILQQVHLYGHQFLTSKALHARASGATTPADPYWPNWYEGKKIGAIFDEVHGMPLYRQVYGETSRWIHWSPRGLGAAIRREGEHVRYTTEAPEWAATALAAGFQALIESAIRMDTYLNLGFAQRLTSLRSEYLRRLIPEEEP